jgi:hypothetical protein
MEKKHMIIGAVILIIVAIFIWYMYTLYISTKKNYEKIYTKYYNKKFMIDNKDSKDRIVRQMISDLLPATKYKLKFCDDKNALEDSPIDVLIQAFGIVSTTKYSEDFDKYELGSISLISGWKIVSTIINYSDEEKNKPENKPIIEEIEKKLSQNKFLFLDQITNSREESIENSKKNDTYLSKEDALKKIRDLDKLC